MSVEKIQTGAELLKQILRERRRLWEEEQLVNFKTKGKMPKDDKWKANYKEPKPVNTSELPRLPKGWCWVRIGAVVERLTNGYVGATRGIYKDSGVPYILSKHIHNNLLTFDGKTFVSEEFNQKNKKSILKTGDVLLVQTGHVGESAVVPEEHSGHNCHALIVITPCKSQLIGEFLSKQFEGPFIQRQFALIEKGMTLRHLNCRDVVNVPIAVAPLKQQKRIVAKLDALFEHSRRAKDALDKVPDLVEKYRQSVLAAACSGNLTEEWRKKNPDVEPAEKLLERIRVERRRRWEEEQLAKFKAKGKMPKNDSWKQKYKEPESVDTTDLPDLPKGWCWCSVEQLTDGDRNCAYGVLQPGGNEEGGVPLVRVCDVRDGLVRESNLKRISKAIAARYPRTRLEGGEVLISLVGTIGRTAIAPLSLAGANVARAIGVIPIRALDLAKWVEVWFRNPAKQEEMVSLSREVARKTLNLNIVRSSLVALPPQKEQCAIVEQVTVLSGRLDKLFSTNLHLKQQGEELDKSVLMRAFSGQLL